LEAQVAIRETGAAACCPARLLSRTCDLLLSWSRSHSEFFDPSFWILRYYQAWIAKGNKFWLFLSLGHQWPRETKKFPLSTDKGRVLLVTRNAMEEFQLDTSIEIHCTKLCLIRFGFFGEYSNLKYYRILHSKHTVG